jgi:hypothetical protein
MRLVTAAVLALFTLFFAATATASTFSDAVIEVPAQ